MIQAGFPVPDGFHVTTDAYHVFVDANNLQPKILAALKDADPALPTSLETASATIGRFFAGVYIPPEIASDIAAAYLDSAFCHGISRGYGYWRSAFTWLDCGTRVWHPGGAWYSSCCAAHSQWADHHGGWWERNRDSECRIKDHWMKGDAVRSV